jgi:hypothetical protein
MKKIEILASGTVIGILVLTSCNGTESTTVQEQAGCTTPVSVSVSAGTTPTFSWTPACKVAYLDVGVVATNQEIWAMGSLDEANTIPSGAKFGVIPPGTSRIDGPVPLRVGTTYYVFVAFFKNGVETDGGRATFTP